MKRVTLYVLCAPMDLLGLIVGTVLWCLSPGAFYGHTGMLLVRPRPGSRLAKSWRYSTTFGHVVFWHCDHGTDVLNHEHAHVRQFEAMCVAWWLICLVSWCWWLPLAGPLAWYLIYFSASLAAWLGGRETYRGNTFEEAARAEARGP